MTRFAHTFAAKVKIAADRKAMAEKRAALAARRAA